MLTKVKMIRVMIMVIAISMLSYGCATTMQYQHGSPIRTDNIGKLVKGKSTKSDVIELFGMPNVNLGYGMASVDATGVPSAINTSGDDNIYIYKRCTLTSVGKSSPWLFGAVSAEAEERCEQLTIMLNKNDVVKAYSYYSDDPVDAENIGKLIKGKSTKSDVIELFGAPTVLNASGGDEIYIYKKSIAVSGFKTGFMAFKSQMTQKTKQLTIIIDKNTEIVKTYSYQPYQ